MEDFTNELWRNKLMLLLRLWNYMRGYVIILCEGYYLGKFINICIHRKISLYDIKSQNKYSMTLKVSAKEFKLLRPIVKKSKCKVKVLGKKGFPFFINRYKKRKSFIVGAFIFICAIYVMASFIWSVDVTGNKNISSQIILEKLALNGVNTGVLKFGIDPDKVAKQMILEVKELAWIGIDVKGTKVKVRVKERVKPPEMISKDIPCNIVAAKDGVIKSIFTKVGQQLVDEGYTVTSGEILISGNLTSENKKVEPRSVHAIGTVIARTWYEKSHPVSLKVTEKVMTGKKKDRYSFIIFSKKLGPFFGSVQYKNHEDTVIKKEFTIGEDFVPPFGILIDRSYEYNYIERKLSLDEAKDIAAKKAYKEAFIRIPMAAKIVKTNIDFITNDKGGLDAHVIVECLEDIGLNEGIGGD